MSEDQFYQTITNDPDPFRRFVDFYSYVLDLSKMKEIESAFDRLEKILG
jgi:hypothetical protein